MRSKIPDKKVSMLWSRLHPKTKQPPVKAYYVNKSELNRIADQSYSGKGKFHQTNIEYGKPISTKTHSFEGVHYKQGKSHVILVHKQETQRKSDNIIRHELKHIKR